MSDTGAMDSSSSDANNNSDASDASNPTPTEILLFGGSSDCSGSTPVPVMQDVWSWNGTTWTKVTGSAPSSRYLGAMATLGTGTVLYSGLDTNDTFLPDTWVYSGSWSNPSITGPGARAFSAMATLGGQAILFGGFDSAPEADTWSWNGSSWCVLSPTGAPGARCAHTMATLGSNIVLFGGTTTPFGGIDNAETWLFDGTSWSQPTISGMTPHVRDSQAMAALGSTVVMFGGEYLNGQAYVSLGDTWVWDGTGWAEQSMSGAPSARFYASMATLGGNAVLFGGTTGSGALAETWLWNGTSWAKQTITNGPGARCGAMMVAR